MKKKGLFVLLLLVQFANQAVAQIVVVNKGIGGNNTNDLLKRFEKDVLTQAPDLVIIMAGANDMVNSKKLLTYDQYRKNYETIIQKLAENKVKVVMMSPLPIDTGYLYQRHKKQAYNEEPTARIDSVVAITKQIARANDQYYIDLNSAFKKAKSPNRTKKSLIINEANMGIADGLHPTAEGYQYMAKIIYRFLKKQDLLRKDMKIVCFGDSITYGSYMEGAGTVTGDSYPAILQACLNATKNLKP